MIGGSTARRAIEALRPRHSPLSGILTRADYRNLHRKPRFTVDSTTVCGHRVWYSDAYGILHSIEEIFQSKVYQFQAKTKTPHIIDAGANVGLSIIFFKDLYPEATVIAYEPDVEIFALLKRNTEHLSRVELHEAAAWSEETTLTFFKEGSLAGSVEMDFLNTGQAVTVKAERLRDEIRKRPVDFLKLDIEGAENVVLFDIADDLNKVDHLFFEYHSTPGKQQLLGPLLELVTSKGFRYAIDGTQGPKHPFVDKVSHGFDLQLNVFCFRE